VIIYYRNGDVKVLFADGNVSEYIASDSSWTSIDINGRRLRTTATGDIITLPALRVARSVSYNCGKTEFCREDNVRIVQDALKFIRTTTHADGTEITTFYATQPKGTYNPFSDAVKHTIVSKEYPKVDMFSKESQYRLFLQDGFDIEWKNNKYHVLDVRRGMSEAILELTVCIRRATVNRFT
jgi:hypothetical protein